MTPDLCDFAPLREKFLIALIESRARNIRFPQRPKVAKLRTPNGSFPKKALRSKVARKLSH